MEHPTEVPRVAFIRAATWHGTLDRARELLIAHPELATADIHVAAICGDDAAMRAHLDRDPASATARSEPYGADALTHLCLSKYLREEPSRSDAFLRAATALLDAGADPNGGFWTTGAHPEHETPLYGAAGVAHHAALTRLLLDRGADPNDEEAVYHSPETDDFAAMAVLVETGRITRDNLSTMLIRKLDWHDEDGARFLLDRGADASGEGRTRGWRPFHHALARGNRLGIVDLLLDRGADPSLTSDADGLTGIALAAREGRGDVLASFVRRGRWIDVSGVDRLIAACAMDQVAAVRTMAQREPALVQAVVAMGGELLAKFAGSDNVEGVRHLLDLGVSVSVPFAEGDGYFDEPAGCLAIHVAAWRGHPDVVELLLERGSPVDPPDPKGRTPLALAIRACVDSHWAWRRTPESVEMLLQAGASVHGAGVRFPCGYDAVDALLQRHGA